jgi:glycosyltransferase involved in cell wall biosynthesis
LRELGAAPVVVPHGVELERFAGEPDAPADLAQFERPLVGFVGLVDEHLWMEAIVAVADRMERGTIVIVGALNTDASILDHPRIELIGFRPFETMPAYIAAFDCCLIPFRRNRLTEAVNPIKLREYLAAGRPVVSTPLPEVVAYADAVSLADSPDEFADAVEGIVTDPATNTEQERAKRRARVADDSWDTAAARIEEHLSRLMGLTP